jgi:hypothetical protein
MRLFATAQNNGTAAWCLLVVAALVACTSSNSTTPSPSGPNYCSTGTQLVLFFPQPGSRVLASTRTIYVVSDYAIATEAGLAAVSENAKPGEKLDVHDLAGPVGAPTPTPAPSGRPPPTAFPSPPFGMNNVFYNATGFHLKGHATYKVSVAGSGSGCVPHPIHGAIFSTLRRF